MGSYESKDICRAKENFDMGCTSGGTYELHIPTKDPFRSKKRKKLRTSYGIAEDGYMGHVHQAQDEWNFNMQDTMDLQMQE